MGVDVFEEDGWFGLGIYIVYIILVSCGWFE